MILPEPDQETRFCHGCPYWAASWGCFWRVIGHSRDWSEGRWIEEPLDVSRVKEYLDKQVAP